MRKRWPWILLPLLLAGGVWLFGKAPSRYALEQECGRYREERVAAEVRFQRDRDRNIRDIRDGVDAANERQKARRASHDRYLLEPKRLEMGGWTVVLIPPGARPPAPGGFFRVESHDPSLPDDAPHLRGEMEIRLAPRGFLARVVSGLGLSP